MGSLSLKIGKTVALAAAALVGLPLSTALVMTTGAAGAGSASRVHPIATGGELNAVACVSAAWCMAVGDSIAPVSPPPGNEVAELWNGSSWSVHAPPMPGGSTGSVLTGVACTSSKSCFAVGYFDTSSNSHGSLMVERWNGSSWAFTRPPTPAGAAYAKFKSVSCPTTTRCVAVGDWNKTVSSASLPLAELWSGTSWKIDAQPSAPSNDIRLLNAASCLSTTFCSAVGDRTQGTPDLTLSETGNGTTWVAQNPANVSGSANYLYGLHCSTSKSCVAVGEESASVLVETWNGSAWTIAKSSDPTGSLINVLTAISCSGTLCLAVGNGLKSSGQVTLTEFQSGTKWLVRASPNVAGSDNTLAGVSCVSATVCIAVGHVVSNASYKTLAEKMTGTSWTITPS